ncbi:DUF3331 domain-containing protein [Paraburkholderia susongensis]|uniref:DUF3331 domain-containing protein n=1 Tax=Paraburkholderia susongensis TaxID=1515439 RepID=UPI000A1CE794
MPEAIPSDRTWSYITALLAGSLHPLYVHQTTGPRCNPVSHRRTKVTVVERHGPSSVVVSWCDPTACCYWDQIWRRCRARKRGFCALTGVQIVAGDDVFRPRRASPSPRNIDAMILASVMETIPLGELV